MKELPKQWVVKFKPKDTHRIVELLRDCGYTHGTEDEEFPKGWANNFINSNYHGEPCIYIDDEGDKCFTGSIYVERDGYELFTVDELFDILRQPLPWYNGGEK